MSVGIAIGTYGDNDYWVQVGERAAESVQNQTCMPDEFVWVHGRTLAEARNTAAQRLSTEFVIFLDADDELDDGYVEAMMNGDGDIRPPSTLGVVDGVEDDYPVLNPKRDLYVANYIVIGAMCRRQMVLDVNGFRELASLEDWDLWIRMKLAGAEIVPCPRAVYRVHFNPRGRNSDLTQHHFVYNEIRRTYKAFANDLQ